MYIMGNDMMQGLAQFAQEAKKALNELPPALRGMFQEMEGMLGLLEGLQGMLAQNGVQGVGRDLGNPKADLSPPALGQEVGPKDLQVG
jgi:hypothetical protein